MLKSIFIFLLSFFLYFVLHGLWERWVVGKWAKRTRSVSVVLNVTHCYRHTVSFGERRCLRNTEPAISVALILRNFDWSTRNAQLLVDLPLKVDMVTMKAVCQTLSKVQSISRLLILSVSHKQNIADIDCRPWTYHTDYWHCVSNPSYPISSSPILSETSRMVYHRIESREHVFDINHHCKGEQW